MGIPESFAVARVTIISHRRYRGNYASSAQIELDLRLEEVIQVKDIRSRKRSCHGSD